MAKFTNVALLALAILVSGSTVFCARAPKPRNTSKQPAIFKTVPTKTTTAARKTTKAPTKAATKKAPVKSARR